MKKVRNKSFKRNIFSKYHLFWDDIVHTYQLSQIWRYFLYLLILWIIGTNIIYISEWIILHENPVKYSKSVFSNYFLSYWNIIIYLLSGIEDKEPISLVGKISAFMILLSSLVMVGIFTGTLTSIIIERVRSRKFIKIKPSASKFKDHIVICGYNEELDRIIKELWHSDENKIPIILINGSVSQIKKTDKEVYKYVWGIEGSPINPDNLLHADIDNARSIIILADNVPGNVDKEQRLNVDSKTLLTAMSIRKVNSNIFICAEILDARNKELFYDVNVDEVIHIQDFFNRLITQAMNIKGIGKFYRLLSKSDTDFGSVYKCSIPENILKDRLTYEQIRRKIINDTEGIQLIGIEINNKPAQFEYRKSFGYLAINPPKIKSDSKVVESSYIPEPEDKLLVIGNTKPNLENAIS
ncbi:MAG: TrkA-related ion transporter [Candidatus Zixiibacteriota bacterium]